MPIVQGMLAASSLALSSPTLCRNANAHYVHSADHAWHAEFIPFGRRVFTSDLALHVTGPSADASYWFLYDVGAAPLVNLISTTDVAAEGWQPPDPDGGVRPLGQLNVFAWDNELMIDLTPPESSGRAAAALFIPGLTEALAHRAKIRQDLPPGIFRFSGCGS